MGSCDRLGELIEAAAKLKKEFDEGRLSGPATRIALRQAGKDASDSDLAHRDEYRRVIAQVDDEIRLTMEAQLKHRRLA